MQTKKGWERLRAEAFHLWSALVCQKVPFTYLAPSFSAAHKKPWTYLGRTWGPKSLKPWGSAYLASWEGSREEDGLGGLYCCRLGLSYILLAVLMWPKGQQSAH